jgi:hypothetical protein
MSGVQLLVFGSPSLDRRFTGSPAIADPDLVAYIPGDGSSVEGVTCNMVLSGRIHGLVQQAG